MATKTFDGQTARFLASVATCMPALSGDVMQGWIGNPRALKKFLSGLMPSRATSEFPEGTIVHRGVRVDRTRTPMEAINATGRRKCVDDNVVATMPQGSGDVADLYYIPTNRYVPPEKIPAFLAEYGLVPDPRAQAADNEANPAFADKHPNCTYWGNRGNNCFLTFNYWYDDDDEGRHAPGGRHVDCDYYAYDWDIYWLLPGVPAPPASNA